MELLTIRETAKRGPLTETTIRRRVKENSIPYIRTGNRAYINYPALLELIDRESRAAVQAPAPTPAQAAQ